VSVCTQSLEVIVSHTGKVAALIAVSAGLAVAPAALALGPSDFAVNIPDGPTQMPPPSTFNPTANCTPPLPSPTSTTPPAPGPYVCGPTSYAWSASATPLTGTVTVVSTGQTGTIALKCDYNLTNSMTVTVGLANPFSPTSQVSGFSGTGGQACSWEIKVDRSSLIGTLTGTTTLDQVNPTTGRFTGNLNIVIVGGTGEYANANGVGKMVQQQEFPFPTPAAPPISGPGGMPSMEKAVEKVLVGAVAHQAGSSMDMKLVTGKPRATFIIPRGKITKSTNWKVHIAAAPGVSCSVKATKGKTTKSLGALKKLSTGQLVGSQRVGTKLTPTGTWTLKPTCKKSGKTLAPRFAKTAKLVISA
jgi:hypothetical protein